MSNEDEATYTAVDEGKSTDDINSVIEGLLPSPSCDGDGCTNAQVTEAERAWVKLMSAVPVMGQTESDFETMRGEVAMPPGETVKGMVNALRPDNPDAYAFETIANHWATFKGKIETIKSKVKEATVDLGNEWTGSDYEALTEQVDIVITNVDAMVDAIGEDGAGGVVGQLREKQETVAGQQGSNRIAYPAPLFYLEEHSGCAHRLHSRVPFNDACDISEDEEAQAAVDKAGLDPTVFDSIREEREEEYQTRLTEYTENPDTLPPGMNAEQAANKDADEYADAAVADKNADGSTEYQAKASEIDNDVVSRQQSTEFEVAAIQPVADPSEDTAFNDGDTPAWPGTDGGSAPQSPGSMGTGSDSYVPPENLTDISGPGGSGGSGSTPSTGLDSENPWSSEAGEDPDDLGGGLASGGGGGPGTLAPTAPGGGPGTGGGSGGMGGGAGAGLFGGAGGMGAGSGAGAGRGGGMGGRAGGMGAGGRGAGAAGGRAGGGGMMGGGRGGAGGTGEDEEFDSGTWLIEDEDIWGLARFEDDNDPLK
ncbi:hypothetical protein [Glycomyces buryatensis]|uniref:WXG100 family type VII secretion target n=1 Tax=Glycomyces buryatensis TaxID=2570927 RepID=A0A4S8QJ81_9ACTN|nr:hypothetical protein [Glycomyces buryatensis]THV40794.1 hypothetical protein FAB82_14185 [Glycomyces buryatensis]